MTNLVTAQATLESRVNTIGDSQDFGSDVNNHARTRFNLMPIDVVVVSTRHLDPLFTPDSRPLGHGVHNAKVDIVGSNSEYIPRITMNPNSQTLSLPPYSIPVESDLLFRVDQRNSVRPENKTSHRAGNFGFDKACFRFQQ